MNTVFVYGTLRNGMGNDRFLYDRDTTRIVTADGKYVFNVPGYAMYPVVNHFPYNFPYCIESEEADTIEVEAYSVNDQVMVALDKLEEYPKMYDRKLITVDGIEGWIYFARFHLSERPRRIMGGNWREFMQAAHAKYAEFLSTSSEPENGLYNRT